jgi:hypothetical protein
VDPNVSIPEGWTAPPELTGALPRETRMSEEGAGWATLVAFMMLAAMALAVWIPVAQARQKARTEALRREGREAAGKITGLWRKSNKVIYAFNANGVALTGEADAPRDTWDGLRIADPLAIRFLPSNPAINHPAGWEASSNWAPLVAPALLAVGVILILTDLRGQRRLVAEGVATAGVVTRCCRGRQGGWAIDYQFRAADGTVVTGSRGGRLEIGAIICVLYLPQDPRKNQPYLGSCYRAVQ